MALKVREGFPEEAATKEWRRGAESHFCEWCSDSASG